MTMTDRQRFWLRLVLAVTMPLWLLPFILGLFLLSVCGIFWEAATDLTDRLFPRPQADTQPTDYPGP